jgi:2-iminobutanoate/2-iminopropanoate deaminase
MDNTNRQVIRAERAPKALGPYSAGIRAGGLVFTAGQVGIDPQTSQLVTGGVEAETRQALQNLAAILEAGGSSLEQVLKTTVFLLDIADFSRMNTVYAEFFLADHPARSAVQVAALPVGASVEIEAVALVSNAG